MGLGPPWTPAATGGRIAERARAVGAGLARRPYHAAAGSLATGLALAPAPPWAPLAAAALGAVAGLALTRVPLALVIAAAICVGAVGGLARIHAIDRSAAQAGPAGTSITGTAVLLEHPRPSLFGSSAAMEIASGHGRGARVLARLDGHRPWPGGGQPGSILRVTGATEAPAVGRGFDWRAYLRRRGIAYEVALETVSDTGIRRGGVAGLVDSLRRRAERALGARLEPPEAALARGMVLGQDQQVDPLEREDFQLAGLSHILAVSGQNVMLLCALALPLLGLLGAGPAARAVVLLGLIAIYVPLAGAGASLQRAGIMGAAGIVALAVGRAGSRWYALELAACVTLAANPRVAGDSGWQLSFAAVVGILVLAPPLQRALRGLPRMLSEGIAVTVAGTVATAPLIAHSFGSISLAGLFANLAALPLVALIMWIGMAQCALAQMPWAYGLAHATVEVLGSADALLIGWLRQIARAFADAPGWRVVLPLGSRAAVPLAYGLIGAAVAAVRRGATRAEPRATSTAAAWRRLPRRSRLIALAAAGAFAAGGWRYATEPGAPPDRPTVSLQGSAQARVPRDR